MKRFYEKHIREKIRTFDVFELGNSFACFYIALFFPIPFLVYTRFLLFVPGYSQYSDDRRMGCTTILYLLLGIMFFIAGYKANVFKKLGSLGNNIFESAWAPRRTALVFALVFGVGLTLKAVTISQGIYSHLGKNLSVVTSSWYSVIGLFNLFGPLALAMAFAYYFYLLKSGNPSYKIWQIIAWLNFTLEFLYGFFSFSHFSAIIPIMVYLIVRHYAYRKSFWKIIITAGIVLFLMMPVQNFYKNKNIFFVGYADQFYETRDVNSQVTRYVFDTSLRRVDQSRMIEAIFTKTSHFLYGKTLLNFFVSLGPPRFIWRDKPVINASGNELGRQYGVLTPDDLGTSVGPTVLGDLYMNFGILGITAGMFVFGSLLKFIYEYFILRTQQSLSGIMAYSIIWIEVIKGTEDWIAPVYAGLVKLMVIIVAICLLLKAEKISITAK